VKERIGRWLPGGRGPYGWDDPDWLPRERYRSIYAVDEDLERAVIVGKNRTIGVLHILEQRFLEFPVLIRGENHFAVDQNVEVVVTTEKNGTVQVWDVSSGRELATTRVEDRRLRGVEIDSAGIVAFSGVDNNWSWDWKS
jgi:hypothetical protein